MSDVIRLGHGELGDCGECVRPNRFVNVVTGAISYSQCYSANPAKCLHCSTLKRGDLKAVFRSGFTGRPGDHHFFATLTAPGKDVLPWDRTQCTHAPAAGCSGLLGCVVDKNAAALWHRGLRKRISYFRQMMRRFIAQEAGIDEALIDVQVCGSWEMQKRGALHRHLMFRVVGSHRVTTDHIRRAFERYRTEFGFGDRSDLQEIAYQDVHKVAGYLAKYCTKDVANLDAVPCGFDLAAGARAGREMGLRRSERFRAWSASRGWGETLGQCRARRVAFAKSGGPIRGCTLAGATGGPWAPQAPLDLYSRTSTLRGVPCELPGPVECFAM